MNECIDCGCKLTEKDFGVGKINQCRVCGSVGEVEKYGGVMVWDHKTAPALEIHGSINSARAASKGDTSARLDLRVAVVERSRRREGDLDSAPISSPYSFVNDKQMMLEAPTCIDRPKVVVRTGAGKTHATFSRIALDNVRSGNVPAHLVGDKLLLAQAVASINPTNIAGISIAVWKDDQGFYVHPSRKVTREVLDFDTKRKLGFRGATFERY